MFTVGAEEKLSWDDVVVLYDFFIVEYEYGFVGGFCEISEVFAIRAEDGRDWNIVIGFLVYFIYEDGLFWGYFVDISNFFAIGADPEGCGQP